MARCTGVDQRSEGLESAHQTGTPCHPEDVTIVYDDPNAQRWAMTASQQLVEPRPYGA